MFGKKRRNVEAVEPMLDDVFTDDVFTDDDEYEVGLRL